MTTGTAGDAFVLLVGAPKDRAHTQAALGGLSARMAAFEAESALARLPMLLSRVRGTRSCAVFCEEAAGAADCSLAVCLAREGIGVVADRAAGLPGWPDSTVLARSKSLHPELQELAAGEGIHRIEVLAPGGRRAPWAASRRSRFLSGSWTVRPLEETDRHALASASAEALGVLETLLPGGVAAVRATETIAGAGAERFCAHGRAGGTWISVEVDLEWTGELDLEVRVSALHGEWQVHLQGEHCWVLRGGGGNIPAAPGGLLRRAVAARLRAQNAGEDRGTQAWWNRMRAAALGCVERGIESRGRRSAQVVLVHLPRHRGERDQLHLPSLGLARIAAYLRGDGWPTSVVDLESACGEAARAFEQSGAAARFLTGEGSRAIEAAVETMWARVEPRLGKYPSCRDIVGISVVDSHECVQFDEALCLAKRIRERTSATVVLGGERDQVKPEPALAQGIDYVVVGDGEAALAGLCHALADGDRDPSRIPGVWSKQGARGEVQRSHLNAMPCPDFSDVHWDHYRRGPSAELLDRMKAQGVEAETVEPFCYLPYSFVKGCTGACRFCSAKEHLDVQAPEKTVDELLAISERHGVRDFVFLNNLINLGPRWLERLCRGLIDARAGIQWTDSCRPAGVSGELASAMREAGCVLLNFGVESGSDRMLGLMRKRLTATEVVSALRATHGAGILNRVNFIAGYLHEGPEDVRATIRLLEEVAEAIDLVGCFQGFQLIPGMGLDPVEAGIVLREGTSRLKTGQQTLAYDEMGGLRWEEKREAIDETRNEILRRMVELGICVDALICEHDLFYLSRRFGKAQVKQWLVGQGESRGAAV